MTEQEIVWAIRHKDARADPSVARLDDDAILSDLESMEVSGLSVQELESFS